MQIASRPQNPELAEENKTMSDTMEVARDDQKTQQFSPKMQGLRVN